MAKENVCYRSGSIAIDTQFGKYPTHLLKVIKLYLPNWIKETAWNANKIIVSKHRQYGKIDQIFIDKKLKTPFLIINLESSFGEISFSDLETFSKIETKSSNCQKDVLDQVIRILIDREYMDQKRKEYKERFHKLGGVGQGDGLSLSHQIVFDTQGGRSYFAVFFDSFYLPA